MANYLIKEETLVAIANALRSKHGIEDDIPCSQMADYIDAIRTSSKPILEGLTVAPTGKEIVNVPPFGSDGYGIVVVEGDDNLIPANIRKGVTIYGTEGNMLSDGGIDTSDATATSADIAEGAEAYVNGVKVVGTHICEADPILSELFVMPTGREIVKTPEDGTHGFSQVTIEGDENLKSENIVAGVEIYGIPGTFALQDDKEVMPTDADQVIEPDYGYSGLTEVTVLGDYNLTPENIVENIEIFGVKGTALSESGLVEKKLQKREVIPGTEDQTIEPEEGFLGLSSVEVEGDPNLVPEHIIEGVEIFGVHGTARNTNEDFGDGSDFSGFILNLHGLIVIQDPKEEEAQ